MTSCWHFVKKNRIGSLLPILVLYAFLPCTLLSAVQRNNTPYQDDKAVAIQQVRDALSDIRYQVNNHESEIRTFDEKLKNVDSIIESVRDQLNDTSKSHKDQLKGSASNLEAKLNALETTTKGLVADLRQFQTHTNESAAALAQYKQKIGELEKVVDQQNQNIEHLQAAMRSLMEALQGKDAGSSIGASDGSTYRVKSGDSLEKIARAHNTTIQALKDLNGLSTDRIVVGKLLKIPQK